MHPGHDGAAGSAQAGAVLTIDLGAVRENYRRLKATLGATKCAGVVKADGYGLGAAQVSRRLWAEGARGFHVARLEEGEALRADLGPQRPANIYVLDGAPAGASAAGTSAISNTSSSVDTQWKVNCLRTSSGMSSMSASLSFGRMMVEMPAR